MKEENLLQQIRNNTRKAIAQAGYPTVEEFAAEHSIDKSTLSRLFNGQREPRVTTLFRIAQALRMSFTGLVEGAEAPPRKKTRAKKASN